MNSEKSITNNNEPIVVSHHIETKHEQDQLYAGDRSPPFSPPMASRKSGTGLDAWATSITSPYSTEHERTSPKKSLRGRGGDYHRHKSLSKDRTLFSAISMRLFRWWIEMTTTSTSTFSMSLVPPDLEMDHVLDSRAVSLQSESRRPFPIMSMPTSNAHNVVRQILTSRSTIVQPCSSVKHAVQLAR